MTTLTISAKGQITLRKEFLQYLGVVPGQTVDVHKLPGGTLAMQHSPERGEMDAFIGCLTFTLKPAKAVRLSIEDMNVIAAQGWAEPS